MQLKSARYQRKYYIGLFGKKILKHQASWEEVSVYHPVTSVMQQATLLLQ